MCKLVQAVQTLGAKRIFADYNDAAAEATSAPPLLGLFWLRI